MSEKTNLKILVADDDRVERTLLKYNLQKAGYDTLVAENGKEVFDLMSGEVGAVLLDLHMPEMDGITCLRLLRERYPDISPIMITANDGIGYAIEAIKHGAFDYLIKPAKPQILISLVEKVLNNFTQARRLRKVEAELLHAREREMDVASRIQHSLLMGQPPEDMPGIDIAHLTIPSQKIDGDFFDFFKITDHSLDIVVGDVMGKGIASALLGAAIKSHLLRALNDLKSPTSCGFILPEPGDIVSRVHGSMISHIEEIETFVTLCYARIDLQDRSFSFVDCGHMRTVHYRKNAHTVRLLEGVNMPLGLPETDPFEQFSVPFDPGDFFFFYSDGLTEAQNPEGEYFGEKRLVDFILENALLSPDEIITRVRNRIKDFSQSDSFDDDFTCVAAAIL